MTYDPERHHRHSVRLPAFDYAGQGWYFVTLVSAARECLFGEVAGTEVVLSAAGVIVDEEWQRSAQLRTEVALDAYVVMPNHLHAIVAINGVGDPHHNDQKALRYAMGDRRPLYRPPRSLGSLIAGFKAAATTRINMSRGTPGVSVWQRNYYEHVIRDDRDLERIRGYIDANPSRWHEDAENPFRVP